MFRPLFPLVLSRFLWFEGTVLAFTPPSRKSALGPFVRREAPLGQHHVAGLVNFEIFRSNTG